MYIENSFFDITIGNMCRQHNYIKHKEETMVVNYTAIREEVIAILQLECENLQTTLTTLTSTVNDIITNQYLAGQAAEGYIEEFEKIVSTTFSNINTNVTDIATQLESICAKYEQMDSDVNAALT